jgi:hypothetical protein
MVEAFAATFSGAAERAAEAVIGRNWFEVKQPPR